MKRIIPLAVVLLIVATALSAFFAFGNYKIQYDTSDYQVVEFYAQMYDISPTPLPMDRELQLKRTGIHAPDREPWAKDVYASGGIIRRYGKADPDIILLGDSHGLMWAKVIDEICEDLKVSVAFNGMIATNPFFSIPLNEQPMHTDSFTSKQKYLFDKAIFEKIHEWKPSLVIIVTRWGLTPMWQVHDLIKYIGEQGGEVLLIEQPPELYIGNNNTSQYFAFLGMKPDDGKKQYLRIGNVDKYEQGRKLVREIAKSYPHCHLFELTSDYLSNDGKALVMEGSRILYYDDDHLSHQGATKVKARLKDAIAAFIH